MAKRGKPLEPTTCASIKDADSCGKKKKCSWNDFNQKCEKSERKSCELLDPIQCFLRSVTIGDCGLNQDGSCHYRLKG